MLQHLTMIASLAALASGIGSAQAQTDAPAWQQGTGMIGADLGAVRLASDFFKFFHLTPAGPANAQRTTDFRPSGPQFQLLARVSVTLDAQGKITAITLVVLRSFIDDSLNGPFARDIAKSYLSWALPPDARRRARALTDSLDTGAGPDVIRDSAATLANLLRGFV